MRRLLLDFGGVVIKTPFEMLHRVGSPEWRGPFDPGSDLLWREMESGTITERDYWNRRAGELFASFDDPVRELMKRLFAPPACDVRRPEVTGLIESVDRPAVLTNDLARFHDAFWLEEMGAHNLFDPLIDLSHTGLLKPAPEAFQRALSILSTEPAQVVFVDDQPHNVQGAIGVGIRGVWFDVTDPVGSVERVRAELG